MVSLGLETTQQDVLQLWRRPKLLFGCTIAAFIVVPVVAYLVFKVLPLSWEAKVGLWVVAITPGAPMIYSKALRRGLGDAGLAASFQVSVALMVIAFAPLWLAIIGALTGSRYWIPPAVIARQVSTVELIPIVLGLAVHHWLPDFARRAGRDNLSRIGNLALLVLMVMLLVFFAPRIVAGAEAWRLLAAALIAAAAIISGHYLAGPDLASRVTIANANAQRNPGLALAIVAWNLPEQKAATVVVVITYVLVATICAAVYTKLYGRTSYDNSGC